MRRCRRFRSLRTRLRRLRLRDHSYSASVVYVTVDLHFELAVVEFDLELPLFVAAPEVDVDERDPEADIIQVTDGLAIEVCLDECTLAFRIGDQPGFSVDVADDLIAALQRIKRMAREWTERRADVRPRSEELT